MNNNFEMKSFAELVSGLSHSVDSAGPLRGVDKTAVGNLEKAHFGALGSKSSGKYSTCTSKLVFSKSSALMQYRFSVLLS